MSTRNIRFLIKQIQLFYDGDDFVPEGEEGREPVPSGSPDNNEYTNDNILDATLIYPRSGVSAVTSQKVCDLPSRRLVEFDTENFWESGLFKEDVDNEAQFIISVSDRDKTNNLIGFFQRVFGSLFSTVVGAKVAAINNLFLGAVGGEIKAHIGKEFNKKSENITVLCKSKPIIIETSPELRAYCYYDKDNEEKERKDVLREGEMEIPLYAVEDIKKVRSKKVEFKAGVKLGEATLILSSTADTD